MEKIIRKTLETVADFCDRRQVGDVGPLGFRRSSELFRMLECLDELIGSRILVPGRSRFLDMGCGDGRVNLFFSYVTAISAGVEIDDWTLDEYFSLKEDLALELAGRGMPQPPDNVFLFQGDSMDVLTYNKIREKTGSGLEDFDLFYTYLTMYEEFSTLVSDKAKTGAVFMVYGMDRIMPKLGGLRLLTRGEAMNGILALYRKI